MRRERKLFLRLFLLLGSSENSGSIYAGWGLVGRNLANYFRLMNRKTVTERFIHNIGPNA
jgi:hypothetical protein